MKLHGRMKKIVLDPGLLLSFVQWLISWRFSHGAAGFGIVVDISKLFTIFQPELEQKLHGNEILEF